MKTNGRGALAALIAILGFTMVACTAGQSANPSPTSDASEAAAASVAPSLSGRPPCPLGSQRGGTCLGVLTSGTYSTTSFAPSFAYTVPDDGWSNAEDREGIFALLAPGESFAALETDADWIGVFRSIGAVSPGCDEHVEPGVVSAQELTEWYASQPGLVVTEPQPTTVGGLSGFMVDPSLAPGWTGRCPDPFPDVPLVNLLMGTGPSEGLGALVEAGSTTRLYLLDFEDDNVVIYVMDHPGDLGLDDYDAVVRTIQFDVGP